MRKVLFIINRFSGTGYRPSLEKKIADLCVEWGFEPILEFTNARGHATTLARQACAGDVQFVFAVGGDGTVNEVAQGLLHSPIPMGILPRGSGNGLARHLHIPVHFNKSLALLRNHEVMTMDTMLVNGNLSVNISGIGFDGLIANIFGKDGKRGLWGYTQLVLKQFIQFREFPVEISIDDQHIKHAVFILAIANASQFGNNAYISPGASVADGLLDVCFIQKIPLWRGLDFASKMFSKKTDRSHLVRIIKGKEIFVALKHPVPYHIDGEGMGLAQQFNVQVLPSSLKILVPRDQSRV
jgi:YegS/Rv2252/BmrU family lipid kinase